MKRLIALCTLCGLLSAAAADKKNTLQRFGEGDMPVIRTKVRLTTLIILPEGEEISEVICGDKEYWVIEGKDSIVYVKPAKEGASTNVNIISKSKAVYSFIVQEISKPGNAKEKPEKPDLKIVLGGDDISKLKKDKENLEELLARTERTVKDLTGKVESEQSKKKEETEPVKAVTPEPPRTETPKTDAPKVELAVKQVDAVAAQRVTVPAVAVAASVAEPKAKATPEEPQSDPPPFRVTTVERSDGLIRKTGRFFGRLFRRVSEGLHLY